MQTINGRGHELFLSILFDRVFAAMAFDDIIDACYGKRRKERSRAWEGARSRAFSFFFLFASAASCCSLLLARCEQPSPSPLSPSPSTYVVVEKSNPEDGTMGVGPLRRIPMDGLVGNRAPEAAAPIGRAGQRFQGRATSRNLQKEAVWGCEK